MDAPTTELEPTASEIAAAVTRGLLGTPSQAGPLSEQINAQVMAQVEAKVDALSIDESFKELREAVATRQPADPKPDYPEPPVALQNGITNAFGLPNPNWYNPAATGAEMDGRFEDFGEYLKAVIKYGRTGQADDRLIMVASNGNRQATLTGEEIELGGALVPEEFRPQLLMIGLQQNSIRPRATVLPMMAPTIQVPAIRDESHRENVFGGVSFNWLEVNDEIDDSEPDFKMIRLNARALAGRTDIPNTLLEDSFLSVPALIYQLWSQAVPWIEEKNFIRGDGVGKPLGILNSPAAVVAPRASGAAISWADIAGMEARLLPNSQGRAVYMAHPAARTYIMQLRNGEVNAWAAPLAQGQPETLVGKPLIYNEHMSPDNMDGTLALVDWMYYLIGDRQALTMEASRHQRFSNHITVLKGIERLDGTPWLDTPITAAQNSTGSTAFQMSPFVLLDDS